MNGPPVRVEREGAIAVIVIDNPPVNAGSTAVRAGLLAAVAQVDADPAIESAVLIGAGSTFVAGSDIREFGKPLADPQLPAVLAAIAASPKPFVAAIHGAALGGGFELALGCDARVAAKGAVVGLPEVTLGMIPGAGGTQHLPRLVGVARAIELACSGRRVPADEAVRLGLVDAVVDGDLRRDAVAFAARPGARKRPLGAEAVPADAAHAVAAAEAAALEAGDGRPAVAAAIAAIRESAALPYAQALANERRVFQELRMGTEAAALRHLFFAEREAAKVPGLESATGHAVSTVAVVGTGTLGAGIARCFADAGLAATLVERDDASLPGVAGADLVVDAVDEELAAKEERLRRLDAVARPGAILAATSTLDIDRLAAATGRPQDVLGLRFLGLGGAVRLLEIVRAAKCSPEAIATVLAVARRLRRPVVVAAADRGGIGRALHAVWARHGESATLDAVTPEDGRWRARAALVIEAERLLAEGVAQRPSDIDLVFVHGFGFPKHEGGPLFWASRQDRARLDASPDRD